MNLLDWTPVLKVMLNGLIVAIGPLVWVWARQRGTDPMRRLHALTWVTVFFTFDLILFGAFTRLTDSGLGCPDWPGCYGSASPLGAHAEITAAQSALPTGPVTLTKAWIEMLHRYFATGVGVLTLVLLGLSWRLRRQGVALGLPALTVLWVSVQGLFGALTVTMKLFPAIVSLHLLGGVTLLALLTWQAVSLRALCQSAAWQAPDAAPLASAQASPAQAQPGAADLPGPRLRLALWAGVVLLLCQIALGAWVSTNYAVLACSEVPTCQGSWWPEMNFAQAFTLWRELGLNPDGSPIAFAALTAIHMVHRLMAVLVLLALGALAWRMKRLACWRRSGRWLNVLLLAQLVTGLSNVVLGWPMLAALLHTGGAAALLAVLVGALAQRAALARQQAAMAQAIH